MLKPMSAVGRREFLTTITIAGGALITGMWQPSAAAEPALPAEAEDQPVFRFLQINDVHVQQEEGWTHPTYRDANRRAIWLIENLNNPEFFPSLDFVLLNGDMIHQGLLESNHAAFTALRALLPRIPVPYYPAVGNHEVSQREGDPEWEEPYTITYGERRQFYSFVHRGVAFVVFNNAGTGEGLEPAIYRRRADRLEAMLEEHAGTPTIVVCHIPVYPVRQPDVLARSFGFHSWKTRESEIAEIIEAHPSVIAVTSGHLHLTGMSLHGRVPQIVFAGTASYPHDVGLFTVSASTVTVEAIRLPSHLLVPETNIHGMQRHGIDFTDEDHPSYTRYLMGTADERRFTIERSSS
ncbi:MAG TPA: metallophosphoesterase [Bacteroidota bacterium]|nr:metallophosphoesterase [Bacteroidota bacterium]